MPHPASPVFAGPRAADPVGPREPSLPRRKRGRAARLRARYQPDSVPALRPVPRSSRQRRRFALVRAALLTPFIVRIRRTALSLQRACRRGRSRLRPGIGLKWFPAATFSGRNPDENGCARHRGCTAGTLPVALGSSSAGSSAIPFVTCREGPESAVPDPRGPGARGCTRLFTKLHAPRAWPRPASPCLGSPRPAARRTVFAACPSAGPLSSSQDSSAGAARACAPSPSRSRRAKGPRGGYAPRISGRCRSPRTAPRIAPRHGGPESFA